MILKISVVFWTALLSISAFMHFEHGMVGLGVLLGALALAGILVAGELLWSD